MRKIKKSTDTHIDKCQKARRAARRIIKQVDPLLETMYDECIDILHGAAGKLIGRGWSAKGRFYLGFSSVDAWFDAKQDRSSREYQLGLLKTSNSAAADMLMAIRPHMSLSDARGVLEKAKAELQTTIVR